MAQLFWLLVVGAPLTAAIYLLGQRLSALVLRVPIERYSVGGVRTAWEWRRLRLGVVPAWPIAEPKSVGAVRPVLVGLSGPLAAYLVPVLLTFFSSASTVLQQPTLTIEHVVDGPGAAAGIRPGDRLIAIGDVEVSSPSTVVELNQRSAGEPTSYLLARDGREVTLEVTPSPEGLVGIVFAMRAAPEPSFATRTARSLASPVSLTVRQLNAAGQPDASNDTSFVRWVSHAVGAGGGRLAMLSFANLLSPTVCLALLTSAIPVRPFLLGHLVHGVRRRKRAEDASD